MSDVKVKISADSTAMQAGLAAANTSVSAFTARTTVASAAVGKMQAAMTTAGAMGSKAMAGLQAAMGPLLVGIGALMGLKSIGDAAGQIEGLSQRFGESAESMQRIKNVADQSETSIETIAKSMNKAELAAVKAAQGNVEMDEAFQTLGVSAEEFMGLSIEDKLAALATGYDESTNKAAALDAMTKIMGKSASEMVPMFAQGGDAIKQMMEDTATASSDNVGRVDEAMDKLGAAFNWVLAKAIDAFGGILWFIDQMSIGIASAIAYVSNLGNGLDAAKQAYDDTMTAGQELMEQKQTDREERKNKSKASNIAEIRKEAQEEETAKADAKKAETDNRKEQKAKEQAEKEEEAKAKAEQDALEKAEKAKNKAKEQAEKKDNKGKVDAAKSNLDSAEDKLKGLEKKASNTVDADSLRKIGGGFAKSDYSGMSKEAAKIQKQVDMAQKQVDYLKGILDALKPKDSTEGVTS